MISNVHIRVNEKLNEKTISVSAVFKKYVYINLYIPNMFKKHMRKF